MTTVADRREAVERTFGARADRYDEVVPFFRPIAARLAEALAERAARAAARLAVDVASSHGALAEQVAATPVRLAVDVASGRGALAHALLAGHGEAHVVAGDLSAGMLRVAAEARVTRLHLVELDAERLPLASGCADVVGCSTSVRFFGDPLVAVGEMRRVARPGGVVGLSELGAVTPEWTFVGDVLRRHRRAAGLGPVGGPGASRSGPVRLRPLESLATEAGLVAVERRDERLTLRFADAHEWWRWIHGQPEGHLIDQLGEGLPRFRDEVLARAAALAGVPFEQTFRIVTAGVPAAGEPCPPCPTGPPEIRA